MAGMHGSLLSRVDSVGGGKHRRMVWRQSTQVGLVRIDIRAGTRAVRLLPHRLSDHHDVVEESS